MLQEGLWPKERLNYSVGVCFPAWLKCSCSRLSRRWSVWHAKHMLDGSQSTWMSLQCRQAFASNTASHHALWNHHWQQEQTYSAEEAKKPTSRNRREFLAAHPPNRGENLSCRGGTPNFHLCFDPSENGCEILVCVHLPSKTRNKVKKVKNAKNIGKFDKQNPHNLGISFWSGFLALVPDGIW